MTKIKKFLLAGIIALSICFCITGCTKGENIESAEYDLGNKYFPLVIIYEDDRSDVVYDKNTNVMYYIYHNYDKYGITPIYNSDGSVKLYEGGDLN